MNFPDRSTKCGSLINQYLTNQSNFADEEIHLLFTLNRWEKKSLMENKLKEGVTLVVDRYSFSGVAYSVAKGLDMKWCKAPEEGLPKPDMVAFLTISAEALKKRNGFGAERLETPKLQNDAYAAFVQLRDEKYWTIFNADCSIEQLHKNLVEETVNVISKVPAQIEYLW